MGLMQGKVAKETLIVMDSFAIPVEGTETRVNAMSEGWVLEYDSVVWTDIFVSYEYMVEYQTKCKEALLFYIIMNWF